MNDTVCRDYVPSPRLVARASSIHAATTSSPIPANSNNASRITSGCSKCATCPHFSTHSNFEFGTSSANRVAYAGSRILSSRPHITSVGWVIADTRFATLYPSLFMNDNVASAHCG
eukprot:31336-Pelagococcus_subviridis.AAC.15